MGLKKKITVGGCVSVALLSGYLWLTDVDNAITVIDERAIAQLLGVSVDAPKVDEMVFEEQVEFIRRIQGAVLSKVPVNAGIPKGQPREPADLLSRGEGLCFDRSRFIEKVLRHYGFETRHIAIYSTAETDSALVSLLTPQVSSHAVTEVRTLRGWLVVDSNERWISLDRDNLPVSIDTLSALDANGLEDRLLSQPETPMYADGFTFVYGLYSRHGMFYPPYDYVPDINVSELTQNLTIFLP